MKFLTEVGRNIFLILSLIFVAGYLFGILNLHFSDRTNYCVMTYMFEYPQFVRISISENAVHPQYGLYAYSEGRYTEHARKMWFDGVPVLFIPGNSGSHMQARSLASVALRKAIGKNYDYHFDFFTVSYNEELSGVYGGVLQSQTRFAAACVSKILSLYKSNKYTKSVPTSVILIGHSMGGLIAKRLMAYPSTLNSTAIAITLAAPLQAPLINMDVAMDDYYKLISYEWDMYVNTDEVTKQNKMVVSIGNGARDLLMPSGLTSSEDSDINALTTAIPGVWVSPDHVSIVWCKQLVMVINKFLFGIVDTRTNQISDSKQLWMSKAKQYFQANRSMILDPTLPRANVTMLADAFWYEDSRRIFQISRPEIDRMTYLMIRLVDFPQHRFVAIESVNVDDRDWVFGCNAMHVYGTHRYCKQATPLNDLTRWTSSAKDFAKRKLATVHLHDLKEKYPEWSHVIVKVSPTRKPIVLNVDVNDHASRVINMDMPAEFSFEKTIIKENTEPNSLYYELILNGFGTIHQSYLLYVEPSGNCKANKYHVSAELHVPWAKNQEYTHYFTHLKRSPMKLRLFTTNPNITIGGEPSEYPKITLLLDPQCTYSISISHSWYIRLAQLVRSYSTVLIPYVAAVVLLAVRNSVLHLKEKGTCPSIHGSLTSEGVKPYYTLVFARLGAMVFMSVPQLGFLFENASWNNLELRYFVRSLLVLPAYMTALGLANIAAAALIAVMVFSSQLAHRLLFRIVWRGGPSIAEKVASGLQKVPMVVSAALVCAVPLSCGAASLTAGAAFYAFMVSKMYEEYLEDYVYKLMAKIAAKICRLFKSKKAQDATESTALVTKEENNSEMSPLESSSITESKQDVDKDSAKDEEKKIVAIVEKSEGEQPKEDNRECFEKKNRKFSEDSNEDEDLNNLNFHVMMFLLWLCVAAVNVPALLTWAKSFKYNMVLKPDTSYHTGLIMSACSACIWQMEGPRKNLRYYEQVTALLFTMAVFILALGPFSLTIVNYGVAFMFAVITLQQICDKEDGIPLEETVEDETHSNDDDQAKSDPNDINDKDEKDNGKESEESTKKTNETKDNVSTESDCDVCNEGRIYKVFKSFRDKFSFSEDT